jgi:thiamine biosynthesis lipoprotein
VIDPRTGRAAGSGVRSATVLAADPARAEALSTAMMVLGVGPGLELQARVGGFEAVLIDEQGDLASTM